MTALPLKKVFKTVIGGVWGEDAKESEHDVRCVRVADFEYSTLQVGSRNITYRSVPESQLSSRLLLDGDIVIEKSGGGENTIVGRAVRWTGNERAITSNFMARLQPREEYDSQYLNYVFFHLYSSGVIRRYIKQTTGIQNLDLPAYLQEKWEFPSKATQASIAAFLDRETARIDELMREQEALLDDLSDKRQATITQAVTKGIDASAPMKPSGVEWIGEIPEGWEVRKIKQVTRFSYGSSLATEAREDGSVPVYGSNGQVGIHSGANTHAPVIVIGRKGSSGKINYSDVPVFAIDTTYFIDKTVTIHDLRWLSYALTIANLDSLSQDTGVPGLNRTTAYEQTIVLPSLEEQQAIAAYLDGQLAQIDELREEVRANIEDMRIHRSALITAAVTGKIDVRPEAE